VYRDDIYFKISEEYTSSLFK